MEKLKKMKKKTLVIFVAMLTLMPFVGGVGMSASTVGEITDYNEEYLLTDQEMDALAEEIDNAESVGKERLAIGPMIKALRGAWSACTKVARGMGMPGCGTVITSGFATIKKVYQRIFG